PLRVVAAARQGADADAVGLGLVAAGVVDLALRGDALGAGYGGHRGVARGTAARLRDRDRAQHRQQDRNAVALRAFVAAQQGHLGDVRDLVAERAGNLVLAFGLKYQAGIDADIAADGG